MAREVLTLGGQIIGAAIGGPLGGAVGGFVGSLLGGMVDPPRLEDRKVQISTYGANVPLLFGTTRTAGILVWAADLEEGSAGGKGGPQEGPVAYATFQCLLSRNKLKGIRKAWANGVLVYDDVASEDKPVADPISFAFYDGSEDQLPDATVESYEGVGNVPAYRGFGHVVIVGMDCSRFGNRVPSMEFEVVAEQGWELGDAISLDDSAAVTPSGLNWRYMFYTEDGRLLLFGGVTGGSLQYTIYDQLTGTYQALGTISGLSAGLDDVTDIIYVPDRAAAFIATAEGLTTNVYAVETDGFSVVQSWAVSGFDAWPSGVSGASLAYDSYYPAINIVFASQFTTFAVKRIDLLSGILGAASSAPRQAFSASLAKGGNYVQINTTTGSFWWRHISPTYTNGAAWPAATFGGFVYRDVEAWSAATYGGPEYEVDAPSGPAGWPTGTAVSTGAYPRAAFDGGRARYLIVDRAGALWTVTDEPEPTVTSQGSISGFSGGGHHDVMYMSGLDAFVVATDAGRLWVIDATDFSTLLDDVDLPDAPGGMPVMRQSLTDPGAVIIAGGPSLAAPYRLYEQPLYSGTVGSAVRKMCLASGYDAAQIDVAELTQRLRGFRVVNPGPLRPAIEQLAQAYSFGAAEEDDKIVFKMRGRASVATFDLDDCIVDGAGQRPISHARAQETSLPRRLSLTAPDMLTDYQPLTQRAERQAVNAGEDVSLAVDAVLTVDECKQAADRLIYDAWIARETAEVTLPISALRLTAEDVVTVDGRRWRITGKTLDNWSVRTQLVADDPDLMSQSGVGSASEFRPQTFTAPGQIDFVLLHAPLLRDTDDTYGVYWAAWVRSGSFPGATLYRTTADGSLGSWLSTNSSIRAGATAGRTTAVLGDWDGGYLADERNSLVVKFAAGTPASTTYDGWLGGANAYMVGMEMLHARTVTANADGTHTLTGLIRGVRGTEQWMGSHAIGEPVVLLNAATVGNAVTDLAQQGVQTRFSPGVDGLAFTGVPYEDAMYTSRRMVPVSPVDLRGERDPSTGDLTITWCRRSRFTSTFCGPSGVMVPLGEASETYTLDVFDGTDVVRTISATEPSITYTATQQTDDFGSLQSSVAVRVAQTNSYTLAALRWAYLEGTV